MALKNDNHWFHFRFRDWLESERVMSMSCAARGLYIQALANQAVYLSIPADTKRLQRLLMVTEDEMQYWPEVVQHFEAEEVNGETRLYHNDLREILNEKAKISETRSICSKKRKAFAKQKKNKSSSIADQKESKSSAKSATRARTRSYSLSISNSQSILETGKGGAGGKPEFEFDRFWAAYPRKDDRAGALKSWLKLQPGNDLVERIVAHVEMMKVSKQWLEDDGKYIPLPTTYINRQRWEDQGVQGLPKASANGAGRGVVNQPGFIVHDPAKSQPLTPEELEEMELWKRENLQGLGDD